MGLNVFRAELTIRPNTSRSSEVYLIKSMRETSSKR